MSQRHTTKVHKNTYTPQFLEAFEFTFNSQILQADQGDGEVGVTVGQDNALLLGLKDWDRIGSHEEIGVAKVPFRTLKQILVVQHNDLIPPGGRGRVTIGGLAEARAREFSRAAGVELPLLNSEGPVTGKDGKRCTVTVQILRPSTLTVHEVDTGAGAGRQQQQQGRGSGQMPLGPAVPVDGGVWGRMEFESVRGGMGQEGEGRWGSEKEGRRKRRVRDVVRSQKELAMLDEQVRQMELRFEWLYLRGPLMEGDASSDDDEDAESINAREQMPNWTHAASLDREHIIGQHSAAMVGAKVMLRARLCKVLFPHLLADSLGGPGTIVWVDNGFISAAAAHNSGGGTEEGRSEAGKEGQISEVSWEWTGLSACYPTGLHGEFRLAKLDEDALPKKHSLDANGPTSEAVFPWGKTAELIAACRGNEFAMEETHGKGVVEMCTSEERGGGGGRGGVMRGTERGRGMMRRRVAPQAQGVESPRLATRVRWYASMA